MSNLEPKYCIYTILHPKKAERDFLTFREGKRYGGNPQRYWLKRLLSS